MNRIPVGATIARAWRFVVRDFLNILGVSAPVLVLSWIPSVLIYAPGAANPQAAIGGDPARAAHLAPLLLPLYLAIFLLMGMQLLGIAELASGAKRSPRWLYLSLKWPVWRLFGSMLFLILVIFLGGLLMALGYGALVLLLKLAFNNATGWALALSGALHLVGGLIAFCAYFYCFVRLTFLLIPVIAANEPGFAVARGWALGVGNFWRMLALLLTVWLPLLVLEAILVVTLFAGVHFPPPHASPAQAAAFQATMNAHAMQVFGNMFTYWYISAPLFVAIMVLFYGFAIGSQVFAYEALKSGDLAPVAGD